MCTAGSSHHVIGSHTLLGIADHYVGLRFPHLCASTLQFQLAQKHIADRHLDDREQLRP